MPEEPQVGRERVCSIPYACEQEIDYHGRSHCLYELLLKIARLPAGRTLADVLQEIAPLVQRITGADYVEFSLRDTGRECFDARFWKRTGESGALKWRGANDSISAWVWTEQQPLVLSELEGEARFAECLKELRDHGVESYTALPVTSSQSRIGVLGLGSHRPKAPEIQNLDFLMRIVRIATLALENRETLHRWNEQRDRLQRLLDLAHELSAARNLEELLPVLLSGLRRTLQHDATWVTLSEEDGRARVHAADFPSSEQPRVLDQSFSLEELPSGRAIKSGKPVMFNAAELRQVSALGKSLADAGIETLCTIPLVCGGQVWGSLNVGSRSRDAFQRDDGEYLFQVGSQVAAALANAQAYREITTLKGRLAEEKKYLDGEIQSKRGGDVVGRSAGLQHALDAAAVVARTDATVIITGETGTGKERIARIIHGLSGRKERSFIKLNCAAIPTGLLESELFGHEKGAFTGAVSQKIGRLELADKGTLFLDEIGDIPLELQPKLLRVLQDYEFERLGGTRTIHVNVRLIAATNRDLGRAVEEKQFRQDLFYRLHVFPIHLPALRERREDIPLLVRYFVGECAKRLGKQIDAIPDQAIEAMMKWDWPGNIRELENFVERSVILSQSRVLQAPLRELEEELQSSAGGRDDTLRSREREHIIQMLRQTRGMLSGPTGAAMRLGMKRTTLQYRMQKLGISRLDYLD